MSGSSSANAFKSGDIRFFGEIYRIYYASLFNYAFQIIKSKNTADQLPAQCRRIFIMSRMEQLKHEEIAQQLNLSVHTVREQVRRALEKLRINLGEFLSILIFF